MTNRFWVICFVIFLLPAAVPAFAQNNFFAVIKDKLTNLPLAGTNVYISELQKGASSDSTGSVRMADIPDGTFSVTFSFVGYAEQELEFDFPIQTDGLIVIYMEPEEEELEVVIVRSTRGSRTIADEPERVEYIGGEELDEKISMDPSSLSMLLTESPGIQVQQVSQRTQATFFKLQGLDGKYTRILSDGLPSFGGLESGLSLLQITPLDLQSVEIIKGSTSTLYGGGAIAGVINLITKDPEEDYWAGLLNRTSAKGTDVSIYRSDIINNFKYYVILNANYLQPYDVDHDGETEIPQGNKYNGTVKMEYDFSDDLQLGLKYGYMNDLRRGGDFNLANEKSEIAYKNVSQRNTLSLNAVMKTKYGVIRYTAAGTIYGRNLTFFNLTLFNGMQRNTFQEFSFSKKIGAIETVIGGSLQTEDFKEGANLWDDPSYGVPSYLEANYHYITPGIFSQATVNLTENFFVTGGLRGEFNNKYGGFFLPRAALLYRLTQKVSFRFSAGLGYKLPEYFTETSEMYAPNSVLPLNYDLLQPEKSTGLSFDVNYRGIILEDVSFQLNALTSYTHITNPIRTLYAIFPQPLYSFQYINLDGSLNSAGVEVSLKFDYEDFSLFTGHAAADIRYVSGDVQTKAEYTPQHKSYFVLMYEVEEFLRIGFEAYYTGRQLGLLGESLRDYWIFGLMTERHFENFSLFLNFENFTDTRQSKMGVPTQIPGQGTNPGYINIFAPLDGFIANAGIKLRF